MKDGNRISGTARTTCPFYEELDAILGTQAAFSPGVLLESSITIPTTLDLSSRKCMQIMELNCYFRTEVSTKGSGWCGVSIYSVAVLVAFQLV